MKTELLEIQVQTDMLKNGYNPTKKEHIIAYWAERLQ